MSVFDSSPLTPLVARADQPFLDEAQLAAVSYLARYGGRTLESYRADLRQFFQWCHDYNVAPLAATRTHIELYRAWMDERGLAASTVDRRLSKVCGYYRFAHIDGASHRTRRSMFAVLGCIRGRSEAWIAASSLRFCTPRSGPRRCTPRSPCCSD